MDRSLNKHMAFSSRYEVKHNASVLEDLEIGDMVEFPREFYTHWGVYLGDEQIVHLTGDESDNDTHIESFFSISGVQIDNACVKIESFWNVANGCITKRNNTKDGVLRAAGRYPRPSDEIVRTAHAMKGKADYNPLWNNCEHFASYLRYGEKLSEQADTAAAAVIGVGAAVVIGGLIGSWFKRDK